MEMLFMQHCNGRVNKYSPMNIRMTFYKQKLSIVFKGFGEVVLGALDGC